MSKPGYSSLESVHTLGSTDTGAERFFPANLPPRPGNNVASLLAMLYMHNSTGDVRARPAIQRTNDLSNWPAADQFTVVGDAVLTADGVDEGSEYAPTDMDFAWYRVGAAIRNNDAGTPKREFAQVAVRFDVRNF